MRKGEQTREMIVERAAQLFSKQGYFGSSLSDIMQETGLEKGGIYNHFHGKDELALAAFDYAVDLTWSYVEHELVGKVHAPERLLAMLTGYRRLMDELPLAGGCPLLNTSVESDDAHPALRERARHAMSRWRKWIRLTIAQGVAEGEFRPEIDADAIATILIATVEGSVMLSKLYNDPVHMHRAVEHLSYYVNSFLLE